MRIAIVVLVAALAAGFSTTTLSAGEHEGHGAMHSSPAMAEGVIKKVDPAGAKLTIAHGQLPNGMAPMTMAFTLKEAAWAKQFKPGDRVRFALDDAMTVVQIERAK